MRLSCLLGARTRRWLGLLGLSVLSACGGTQPGAEREGDSSTATGATSDGSGSADSASAATGTGTATSGTPLTTGGLTTGGIQNGNDELTKTDKVDLLFAIDNSISMGDKQRILAQTVPDLIGRMATPDCIAGDGTRTPSQVGGVCPSGTELEFVPVEDIHIAVISSSLGAAGATELCTSGAPGYDPSQEDMAHLLTRSTSGSVDTFQGLGFLAWDPNQEYGGSSDLPQLTQSFADLVTGVGEKGCGFEAQLESVYRFLIDPKPYLALEPDQPGSTDPPYFANPTGVDQTILDERKAFLRPDSLLAIFTITDENDCSIATTQLTSTGEVGTQFHVMLESEPLWRPSAQCDTDPNDVCCASCGSNPPAGCDAMDCSAGLVYERAEDHVNLRCFDQKRRFGVDMLYPVQRYIDGIENQLLNDPDNPQSTEGVKNPIYDDLQCEPGSADCKPPRDRRLIFWVGIVGVPWQDLAADPGDFNSGLLPAEELTAQGRWALMVGDPANGTPPSDPFMVESVTPRSGAHPLTGTPVEPADAAGAANPINGHEWNTGGGDLQYACVFELPEARDCSTAADGACDCVDSDTVTVADAQNPLCQEAGSTTPDTTQRYAKAYPSTRILQVLQGLSQGAVVASICPGNLTDPTSATYGYRPVIPPLMDEVKKIIIPK